MIIFQDYEPKKKSITHKNNNTNNDSNDTYVTLDTRHCSENIYILMNLMSHTLLSQVQWKKCNEIIILNSLHFIIPTEFCPLNLFLHPSTFF